MLKAKGICKCCKLLAVERGPLSDFTTSGTPNSENTLSSFGMTVVAAVYFTVSTTGYLE